jgi:hypothetical protein
MDCPSCYQWGKLHLCSHSHFAVLTQNDVQNPKRLAEQRALIGRPVIPYALYSPKRMLQERAFSHTPFSGSPTSHQLLQ